TLYSLRSSFATASSCWSALRIPVGSVSGSSFAFFFTATATPETYTLSLHDALPILLPALRTPAGAGGDGLLRRCAGPCGALPAGAGATGRPRAGERGQAPGRIADRSRSARSGRAGRARCTPSRTGRPSPARATALAARATG